MVVPNGRKARHLDRVRADPVRDVVALREERNETVEVGGVLDSDFHGLGLDSDFGNFARKHAMRTGDFDSPMPGRTDRETNRERGPRDG